MPRDDGARRRMRIRAGRSPALALALAALAWAFPSHGAQSRGKDLESVVKVEFIARFTDYIDWPAEAFAADSAFHLCTVGQGPLLNPIKNLSAENRLKDRPVVHRSLDSAGDPAGCHIIYFAPDAGTGLEMVTGRIGHAPVLTIGDSPGFGKRGLMINLFLEGTRVRFHINAAAAKANGLLVSAKLLVLGKPPTGTE